MEDAGSQMSDRVFADLTSPDPGSAIYIVHLPSSFIHKRMVAEIHPIVRKPSAGMTAVRVVLITILATLFCFAVALFLGILGFFLANVTKGGGLDMSLAYRDVAFPVGAVSFVAAFVLALRSELRRYRRARADYADCKRAA
jgi:hypothetical protein